MTGSGIPEESTATRIQAGRRRWWRLAGLTLAVAVAIAAVMFLNAWRFPSRQLDVPPAAEIALPDGELLERFAAAIRIPTVSTSTAARRDTEAFERFHRYLGEAFPELGHPPFSRLSGEDFGDPRNRTLLYRWPGANPELAPILLMAHYDVVPVENDTRSRWTHPPFSGHIGDEYVWGRGTLDVKDGAIGVLEAVSHLLGEGYRPERTVFVSLGHDEEIGGTGGNRQVAEWMRREGIRLHFVVDEGGCILKDFPGLERSVALIGIAEKGYVNVRLTVELAAGGHSSMPPRETAIGILSAALTRLDDRPLPARLSGGGERMLDYVGPELPPLGRFAVANRWLFGPLITRQLAAKPSGNAFLRTTIAPTLVSAGTRENVLPTRAEANLNIRLLPGDRSDEMIETIRSIVDDPRVNVVAADERREASRLSSTRSEGFRTLQRTVHESYPQAIVAPFVLVGGTDSAHFRDISRDIYRFMPARLGEADLKRIHGIDERIAIEDYLDLARYYIRLIRNATTRPGVRSN